MEKSAEEFIREKSFPNGITDDKWEEHKHSHSGTNLVEFAIKAMEEYTKQELIGVRNRMAVIYPENYLVIIDGEIEKIIRGKHYFAPKENDKDFCSICGYNFRNVDIHYSLNKK